MSESAMNSLWQRYRKLFRSERHDLLLGFALIPAAALAVRMFGVKRWTGGKQEADSQHEDANVSPIFSRREEAQTVARMIEAASRNGIARGNCLSKSLALWWLLRRKGIHAEMRIGARKADGVLEAHAWVELGGEIINDTEDVRGSYATFEAPMTGRAAARK